MGKTLGYGEITVVNMTEPFTVMLTNEAQQFATDSNRKVTSTQSYYTDIIVIRGSQERTDYTIGNITSGSGITVSKNSKRVTFSVSAGTTIGADTGVIEIPITLDGQTVKKQFSWSCGKQGPQGVKGEDGSNFAWNLLKGTGTAKEFTPKGNLTNQATLFNKLDLSGQTLKEGDKFVISCDLEWTQFTQGTSGTFDYWFQGSVDYSWSYDNIFTQGLQKVQPTKAEILASDGKKHLSAVCTMKQSLLDKKIFEIGIRFDNTDGTGKIKISNLKIAKEDKESPWCLHPDELKGATGDKGKSVQSVIEYYLATSASTGVTTSTSGWSTDPTTQKLTAEKKYLWNCKQTVYDDGTRGSITSPVICGTYGETGKNALQSNRTYTGTYTTVGETAYASTSSFNRTPIVGDIYTCLDGSSNTGTWQVTAISGTSVTVKLLGYVKSKGEDGKNGADGDSFAWNMLSETNCGKKHWGTESSGGKYSVEDFITEDNIDAVKLICTEAISTSNWSYVSFKDIKMLKQLKPSTKYTLSYDIKANRSGAISHSICKGDVSNFCTNTVVVNNIIGNETWQHISVVLTTNDLKTTPTNEILYLGRNALSKVGYSIIKNLKLVEGDIDTPWSPSQSDIEGKGVVETVQYYLATSQASGVTSSTSGWSTDITTQKLTADKKYLWNCYQTKYSDGTSEPISTPKVIGVYGDKGQKGDNAKNLSITPSSQYFKSTDGGKTFAPNTITIKPTIQGEISFGKWQYSIDGGVSFVDVVSGQKGLTISNNVLTVSKDSSLYSDAVTMVTFRAVADDNSFYDTCSIAKIYDVSDIGDGRNLLWNSNFAKTDETINTSTYTTWGLILRGSTYTATIDTSVKHNNFNTLKVIGTKAGENGGQDLIYRIKGLNLDEVKFTEIDVKYTLSFYAKASIACNFSARYSYDSYAKDTNVALSTDWKRYEIQMHPTTASYQTSLIFKMDAASTVWFSEFKLEKGSSATGYSTAPEDLQTAILSTKSEISDVSLKVDENKQAIEQRVEKTTYEQDLNLVKGDISKANEGLNKWRYEIYPKSLFDSTDQGKSTIDIFAKNKNLTPSRTVLFNDTDLSIQWNSAENYIGYALTFTKFSAAKSVAITFAHDDGAHIYLNGKLIGGSDAYNKNGESLTLGFVKGWNCIEVVVNEGASTEGFKLGTTISAISECQLMNCYYGTPVARQSHITNQLVQNTTDIKGISTKVSKVTSVIGDNGENFTSFKNDYSDFKQTMNGFKTTVGQTYVTKDDFNGLEIGGRNLLLYSQTIRAHKDYYDVGWLTDEVETFNGCPVWSVKNQWGRLVCLFKSHVIDRGLVKVGDTLTYSLYAKTNNASGKSINCSYRFKGKANAYWFNGSAFNVGTSWTRYSVTFTVTKNMLATDTYMTEIGFEETASMSGDDKVYYACPKLERGTKATDYTPAPEDNEINGQNLVSNLPSNWEQGSINYTANLAYGSLKSTLVSRLRTKDVFPVSGNITISAGTSTNSSKEELNFYYVLFDINKKSISHGDTWQSLTSPKIINCGDAKYMAIILRWGSGSTAITPSDISQICLKIERGTSATPFTLAPEDVNGKIVNVETIANQTANKFSWIVKSGTSASNFEITDKFMNLVSTNINLDGIVSFMNTAKGDGRKNLYNLDYSSFENVASQEDAICYAKDNGVTSVGIDSSVSYDGDKSLKISYTTANLNSSTTPLYLGSSTNNYGCVKIQAGKQYILSCYVKSDSTTGMFMIDIQGHDTPDTKTNGLYLSNIDPRKLPGSSTGANLSTDWQRAVCAIKVADNATGLYWSVVPLIWGKPSSSNVPQTFNVWVDCIMLEEVDSISNEPGTYILDKETIIDGGSVKADTITGNQILAGSITADKIATDAIKSHNYISSGGTQGSFLNLGDGSFTSPNLSWDSNGNLIAKNANLSGEITATNGSIAGWTIISNKMYTTGSGKYTGIGKYGSAYAFWAGATSNDNGNSAVFKVGHTGKLTATDADITGTITATNGKIGRYDITSTYLMTNSGSNASGIGGNQAFWAGAEDSNSAPFRVGYDGVLWAENAAIRGSIETGNLGDEGDTVSIINGHIGIQGTSNNVEIYSTGFKFGIDGDYYLMSVSEGVKCYRNLYATDFVADGWLYCSEVHSSGAVVIGADSESFYWAHGYQIARGTSWGGVCVGDDSQQLRLYGSSIWASHSISTSDENLKENFTTLDQYENFYMNLNPIGFNYIGDYDGKKTHFGFGAHKTEDVLESEGYDADKFAVVTHRPLVQEDIEKRFGKDVEVDIETEYGVSYTEFIALNTHMIQKTRRELTKVKQEKADLEVRLQAIEAKLGL